MPRYYFDVKNGHRLIDPAGVDCVGDDAARKQAEMIAHQIAADVPASVARRVAVLDDKGREVAVIPIAESNGGKTGA